MDIIFKGRHTEVQERFRRQASAKLGKIEKLDHKTIRVDVEISTERNPRQSERRERVELTIRSRGPVIRAEAAADDRYIALDRAVAKLEERMRRSGGRRKAARHGLPQAGRVLRTLTRNGRAREPTGAGAGVTAGDSAAGEGISTGPVTAGDGNEPEAGPMPPNGGEAASDGAAGLVPIQMEGDCPVVVREKFHTATPMSVDQALLEMELVGHDFYLFRDGQCGLPSVVYRRHGYQYGLIRLVEQASAGLMMREGART